MTLKIISADAVLFDGTVSAVTMPGSMGEFTVLRNHASLLATLAAGNIRYTDESGVEQTVAIPGGIADVDDNKVSVCVY